MGIHGIRESSDGTNFEMLEYLQNNNCPSNRDTFFAPDLKSSVFDWLMNNRQVVLMYDDYHYDEYYHY